MKLLLHSSQSHGLIDKLKLYRGENVVKHFWML